MHSIQKIVGLIVCLFGLSLSVQAETPRVVATASMIQDMAQNIVGDLFEVECIVPIGSDPHLHDPTPRDVKLVTSSDLVLKNGLTFEGWLEGLITNSGTKAKVITVSEGINAIGSDQYENSADPHAWMSAINGIAYVTNIRDALIELDPDNASTYEANYQAYKKQLEELDNYIKSLVNGLPKERRVLITSHDAFQYFGQQYGIQLEAVMGTSTEVEAQTSDIIRLTKIVREKKVPAVFVESTINPKMLQQFAKDNGVEIGGKLYADSIGDKKSPANSYINMLKYDAETIVKALSQELKVQSEEKAPDSSGSNYLLFGLLGLVFLGSLLFLFKKLS